MVVAPTRAMLDAAESFYGPFKRSQVIPNGRDPQAFSPGPKSPFVFAAGRFWDKAKNVRALDKIAERLDWPVYVAGDNEGVEDGCAHRLGRLSGEDLAGWLRSAPIYALPARYEPFGLSILEAALSGCALVLGDIPSLRENWSGCALFVNPEDSDEITDAVQRLIDEPDLRKRLAESALKRAEEFGLDRFAAGYLDVYRQLTERVRPQELAKAKALLL
jgi:glycosyltransferase involved in cell wall biosynthesis